MVEYGQRGGGGDDARQAGETGDDALCLHYYNEQTLK